MSGGDSFISTRQSLLLQWREVELDSFVGSAIRGKPTKSFSQKKGGLQYQYITTLRPADGFRSRAFHYPADSSYLGIGFTLLSLTCPLQAVVASVVVGIWGKCSRSIWIANTNIPIHLHADRARADEAVLFKERTGGKDCTITALNGTPSNSILYR